MNSIKHPFPHFHKDSSSSDKSALASAQCSDSQAIANPSILFGNGTFIGDTVDAESGYKDGFSDECWVGRRLHHDKELVRMDSRASDLPLRQQKPSLMHSNNLFVFLNHALRQGLTFRLPVLLANMLGCATNSTHTLLASSRLANPARVRHKHGERKVIREESPKVVQLKMREVANGQLQHSSAECSINLLPIDGIFADTPNLASPRPSLDLCADGQISGRKILPEDFFLEPNEGLPSKNVGGQLHVVSTGFSAAGSADIDSSLHKVTRNGPTNLCESVTSIVSQQQESKADLKDSFPETVSSEATLQGTSNNSKSRNFRTDDISSCAEANKEPQKFSNLVGSNKLREKSASKVPHSNNNNVHSEHGLASTPRSKFRTCLETQDSNASLSGRNLSIHKEYSSKHHQEPMRSFEWFANDHMCRNVNTDYSNSYFQHPFQQFWSPSPACNYPCTPDGCFGTHPHYATFQGNPLAQSCPSLFCPYSHSQYRHACGRQCFINKCLMDLPDQGKSFDATSCPLCLQGRECFFDTSRSGPLQNEIVMHAYQSSPSVLSDCSEQRSACFNESLSSEDQRAEKCGGIPSRMRQRKLLWLSEDEVEIIRLIRLSQVKGLSRCSSSYQTSGRASPVSSTRMEPEIQKEAHSNEIRDAAHISSRVSSSSLEEFTSKVAEPVMYSPGFTDSKCLLIPEDLPIDDDTNKSDENNREITNQGTDQKQKAASCIQHFWREHMEKRTKDHMEEESSEALNFMYGIPNGLDHLLETAALAMNNGQLVRWFDSLQKSAMIIQNAWKLASESKKDKMLVPSALPRDLKELYKLVAWRNASKKTTPPSFERFVKLIERLQATTEGARIRRRLKSRRLQIIVKEIKEIRVVLHDLSREAGPESSLNLHPQLTMQLQQKLLQLQTALSGTQDAARVLLRRCPATPLVICSSKSNNEENTGIMSPSTSDSGSVTFSSVKFANEVPHVSQKTGISSRNVDMPLSDTVTEIQRSTRQLQPKRNSFRATDCSRSSLNAFIQPLTSPRTEAAVTETKNCEKQIASAKERREKLKQKPTSENKAQSDKRIIADCPLGKNIKNDQSAAISMTIESDVGHKHTHAVSSFQESELDITLSEKGNRSIEDSDSEEISQTSEVPKHPFLKRKSKAMPAQKLDWSKVKPMVSSRLEPELKTRLLKAKFRGAAVFRKKF
ncbi:hypothetical protein KP509_22G040200 [Ceratopteris richardii]|uniref:Uncharacterized protein n=1 Tax=Ceratopteris richardii TaxID=49495 RepID=A0A8T2S7G5_CERRI|nr:hypothetical protein KP509_22G040200 [Ceratopteris richardii]